MNKNRQNPEKTYDKEIIAELAEKYDFTARYIRQILNDDRTPLFSDTVKSDYETLKKQKDLATETRKQLLKQI